MTSETIYQYATKEMRKLIQYLLSLSDTTAGFTSLPAAVWQDEINSGLLLCGKGLHIDHLPQPGARPNVWLSRSAIPFSLELAATGILYNRLREFTTKLIDDCYASTDNFTKLDAAWVHKNPNALPIITHVTGTFSKQALTKLVGPVSGTRVSKPAAKRIAAIFSDLQTGQIPTPNQIQERIKTTTEGIVRDLVGRLLLEEFVAVALRNADVPFKREDEYKSLAGVVYDFRSDFVVPHEDEPRAFLEVRKSSSRHASLYAKDKMFSAINWKGRHPKCLGILIVDGPWTGASLAIMSNVFDYVIPISNAPEIAGKVRSYLDGDESVLQWLIHFSIERLPRQPKLAIQI